MILTDMRMPGLDGLEATRRIRATAALQGTVIIAISASAFKHNRAHCLEAGADDFLPKPFRRERLLDLLCAHLGLARLYAADGEDHAVSRPQPPGDRSLLPAQQLEGLIGLAWHGDVKNLLAQASRLEQPGAGYAPFAAELCRLVEGFQMKQLREWLKSLGETS